MEEEINEQYEAEISQYNALVKQVQEWADSYEPRLDFVQKMKLEKILGTSRKK